MSVQATPSYLEMRHISKKFGNVYALKDVSFTVHQGECHAICGENGAGKSTLMKILSGIYVCDVGEIRLSGDKKVFRDVADSEASGIAIIYQELSLVPELSVIENIFLGREISKWGVIQWKEMFKQGKELLDLLGLNISIHEPVKNLGVGQQQLIEIAKALSKNARILVLDEPTAALSDGEIKIFKRIVKDLLSRGVTCILISHKLDEVFELADRITVLRDGQTIGTRKTSDTNIPEIVSDMVGRELKDFYPYEDSKSNTTVFGIENYTVYHAQKVDKEVVSNVSFSVAAGEVLGVFGLVGAGRTELMMSLFGTYPGKSKGTMFLEGKPIQVFSPGQAIAKGMSLVSEDRKRYGLVLEGSVLKNITLSIISRLSRLGKINKHEEVTVAQEKAKELKVKAASLEMPARFLSGGNQQKIVLAKYLLTKPKVLFLDEPTRGIDIGAKSEIYAILNQLKNSGVAIVMVSSELPEILGVSDRVIVISGGKHVGEFSREEANQSNILACATRAA